jgi:hypothetical protein
MPCWESHSESFAFLFVLDARIFFRVLSLGDPVQNPYSQAFLPHAEVGQEALSAVSRPIDHMTILVLRTI